MRDEEVKARQDAHLSVEKIIQGLQPKFSKAVVLTPTTGRPHLADAIKSVSLQSFQSLVHMLVVDGAQYEDSVREILSHANGERCETCVLPHNTGQHGINGHRIYAAFPLLLNADYILFLDEDNWFELDHVSSLVDALENSGADWAHSMRKIYTHDGVYVADDNCESLGGYRPFSGVRKGWPSYVDTNCYLFRRSTIAYVANYWYHPLKADRFFFQNCAKQFPNYVSSKKYSVGYRLREEGPVSPSYILEGNRYMMETYGSKFPWS